MAEANCLPESHQSGSSQTYLLEEGSSASQPITTVSSMNLHVYGWDTVTTCMHMYMYMYMHYKPYQWYSGIRLHVTYNAYLMKLATVVYQDKINVYVTHVHYITDLRIE